MWVLNKLHLFRTFFINKFCYRRIITVFFEVVNLIFSSYFISLIAFAKFPTSSINISIFSFNSSYVILFFKSNCLFPSNEIVAFSNLISYALYKFARYTKSLSNSSSIKFFILIFFFIHTALYESVSN